MAVDKTGERVRGMFGEIAARYDLLNHLLSLNVDKYWRRYTVRKVPPRDGTPILDICTGTGDLALAYRKAAGEYDGRSGRFLPSDADDRQLKERSRGSLTGRDFCRSRRTAVAVSERLVPDRQRGLWLAECERYRPRFTRNGASLSVRRTSRGA